MTRLAHELAAALACELAADPALAESVAVAVAAHLPEPTAPPPAYTVDGLAAALGVSAKTIRGAINRGELLAVRRGGRLYVAREAVERWATPNHRQASPRRPSAQPNRRVLGSALEGMDGVRGRA